MPEARLLAWTVRVAVDPEIVDEPRVVLPSAKVTVPVGAALPLAGFTVAVSTVLPEEVMLAGFATTAMVVGDVTVTVIEPPELMKLLVAA